MGQTCAGVCENLGYVHHKGYSQAGKAAGLRVNFHGDELNPLGGAEMGAQVQAEAISHLEEVRSPLGRFFKFPCFLLGMIHKIEL